MANPNPKNQWPKGKSANPNGRMAYPDWFKKSTPSALAMIVAVGTGRVHDLDEDTPEEKSARADAAKDSPTPLRLAAAGSIVDRVIGKPKETLEVKSDDEPASPAVQALLALATMLKQAPTTTTDEPPKEN